MGTVVLSGNNTYTGSTVVSAGTLNIGCNALRNGLLNTTSSIADTASAGLKTTATTLTLDYSTQDNSKLADGAALVLSGGTLDLSGGTAALDLQYSNDLGITDLWAVHTAAVPGSAPTPTTVNSVTFVTIVNGALIHVEATVPASAAAPGTSLFGRLKAEE